MAKEVLKQIFQEMHRKIVDSIDPDPVIDVLFSKNVIGSDDHQRLREVPDARDRCRELLSLLYVSIHPQTFIHLRLALLPKYSWIVDEIDKKLPSLTSQLQQLHPDNSADEECTILPRSSKKNQLHEALENERFEDASRLIASSSEADLVECFESPEGSYKSCLHIIAEMSDTQQASKLCRELMERIENAVNREYLLNMRTVEEVDMIGWKVRARVAAIHIAAYNGNSGVVRLLCQEYGVDVNCSTSETLEEEPKKGITPLEWAARMGHTEVVKTLIDSKVDVNKSRPTDGTMPMHIAAQQGHTEVVKLLLDNGAGMNASRYTDCITPLYIAAWNGHTALAKLLLDNKANVNASHRDGVTPLYVAAGEGYAEIVKLLIENKADVNASTHADNVTPLFVAAQNGYSDVVKLLLANKADGNAVDHRGVTPLFAAAWNGHTEVVKLLLTDEVDVNATNRHGVNLLLVAARNGHVELAKLLVDNKADVNASMPTDGVTSLCVAAQNGHTELVELLLANKADVNASDCNHATPLYVAAQNGHAGVVKLLLANNADVNASRADGEKPIDAAQRNHHLQVVGLLK